MEKEVRNLHGQKMGRKGRETRQRIMDVTLEMLKNRSYKDLTVSDVAFEADVSSSTFYVYFEDIEDVLFACVQAAALNLDPLYEVLNAEWTEDNLESRVRRFVEIYGELWEKYRIELRIRNLEADQGNLRFLNLRIETTRGILQALGKKIAQINPRLENPQQIAIAIHAAMGALAAQHDIGIAGATRQTRKQLSAGVVELLYRVLLSKA
ncbi:TetR/AcrR family transcriptional regulator [Mangrovimicrobium sediminis]|uniref:TetR/AcrR family transcriptional regulator n=1 Tax=Mangrovimicrobium sediminis TaxID=2562682 RepID=UPI001436B5C6|nr:TetR/AcrR family transcriptional regulator [Haliea sp. SAOS-164]